MLSTMHPEGVVGHVLLNWFSTIAGRAATMRLAWDDLDPELRERWLADMERIAIDAAQLCESLARGLPVDDHLPA